MVDPDEALRLVLQAAVASRPQSVPLAEACGMQLAEAVRADRDYPPFDRSMMDGYAVRLVQAGRTIDVAGEIAAGQHVATRLGDESCFEIMTGAPCPPGTEAVVQKERVRREGDRVTLPEEIPPGEHIAPQGSECEARRVVLQPGQTITPLAVATMASFGLTTVEVVPRPRLAVITTGAELIPGNQEPKPGQIRDSNGPMLVAMAGDVGVRQMLHLHAEDRLDAILDSLAKAADRDVVLLTGGVSVGSYDLVPRALQDYGAETVFHKVSQKPGKPLLFAKRQSQLIFGLPGNPLASHLCFHRYVTAAIRQMESKPPVLEALQGCLVDPFQPKRSRAFFVPAHAERADNQWAVNLLPGTSSADVFTSAGANCYARVPPGKSMIPAGESLPFSWIGNAPWSN